MRLASILVFGLCDDHASAVDSNDTRSALLNKKIIRLVCVLGVVGALLLGGGLVQAESADQRLATLDAAAARVAVLEENPNFRRAALFGAARNMVAVADHWASIRPQLEQSLESTVAPPVEAYSGASGDHARGGRPISMVTLGASRYSGFTQNETSTAWCGANVVIGLSDTGSEIRTILGSGAVSALGYSNSTSHGRSFTYVGQPTVAGSFYQATMGDPSLACADSSNFYYASLWSDNARLRSGAAVARSTDGGHSFAPPVIAVSKNAYGHIIDHDWLAIDRANPSNLYLTYLDIDFSGTTCGFDDYAQAVPRYAIELVAYANSGATWSSASTVVEEVCANNANPNVFLGGPQVAVAPDGTVYVAWEAMGEHGGSLVAREIRIAKSINQGATFATPVVVAPVTITGNGADLQGSVRASEFPSLAIGTGRANSGFVYLAWSSAAFTTPDAVSTIGTYGFADIMFSQSQDAGTNWSTPTRVNNNREGGSTPLSDQFKPAIATDKNGRIGVCFYDRRRDLNNFLINRYCVLSSNAGRTWHNRKITPQNFPSIVGQNVLVAPDYMGDYDTVATDSTGQSAGFIGSYSSNAAGNPNVMTNHF